MAFIECNAVVCGKLNHKKFSLSLVIQCMLHAREMKELKYLIFSFQLIFIFILGGRGRQENALLRKCVSLTYIHSKAEWRLITLNIVCASALYSLLSYLMAFSLTIYGLWTHFRLQLRKKITHTHTNL